VGAMHDVAIFVRLMELSKRRRVCYVFFNAASA